MSQNSLVLPTSGTLSGLAAVQGINNALDTLNTLASGSAAPSGPEAGQLWHDTANNALKIRSLDNTTWIYVIALDEVNYLATPRVTPTLFGLILSNDATTPNSVIDIAAGGAVDSTATYFMRLTSGFKKSLASNWTSGSGNGGLDTGTVAASSTYHVHLIYNPTSKAVDLLFSQSYSSPGLPSGFTAFVPIGAVTTNSSSQIRTFTQIGNQFVYASGIGDVAGANAPGATAAAIRLTVPTGLSVQALFRGGMLTTGLNGGNFALTFTSPYEGTQTSSYQDASLSFGQATSTGATLSTNGSFIVATNTSGQINVASTSSPSNLYYGIFTYGYVYPRGLQ